MVPPWTLQPSLSTWFSALSKCVHGNSPTGSLILSWIHPSIHLTTFKTNQLSFHNEPGILTMPWPSSLSDMVFYCPNSLLGRSGWRRGHTSTRDFILHTAPLRSSDQRSAGMHVLTCMPGQAGPEVAGVINPVAIAAVSVHLPLRDLQKSYIMPFASGSSASCSTGRHVGHPSPLSSTTFCSLLIMVNYNRGQHIFQDSLFFSCCSKSAGPAPCPHNLSERNSVTH